MKPSTTVRMVLTVCCLILAVAGTGSCVTQPGINYRIDVTLDTLSRTLTGQEQIVYVSGADQPLNEMYMHVYANAYRGRESTVCREAERNLCDYTIAHAKGEALGYCDIRSIKVNGQSVSYEVDDTSMRIALAEALMPGDSCLIDISFVTKIPNVRHRFCYQGHHYSIAQWYPKMAVYDDNGWRTDKYHLIGEFYGDFASFDVSITLPQQYYVGATGYLVEGIDGDNNMPDISESKDSVLHKRRLMKEAIASGNISSMKTLVFHEEQVHDFAWVAAPCYVKDEGEWNGVKVTALVFRGARGKWKHLLEYSLDAIQFWSEKIALYPYSHLTVAEAYSHPNGGMEYPTLSMIDPTIDMPFTNTLDIVTAHEIGHIWWYGIIANDEQNEPWLDEGFNEYYTILYADRKYGEDCLFDLPGILSPMLQISYKNQHEVTYLNHVAANRETVIDKPAHLGRDYLDYSAVVYIKGAFVLDMLNYLVGDTVFNDIIRAYYTEYQFKHPTTDDFIRVAEEVSGEELSWFFDQWLRTSKTCDYALGKVEESMPNGSGTGYSTVIVVERKGEIVMPVDIELVFGDGKKETQRIFVEGASQPVPVRTEKPISSVRLDPEKRLLETNRLNNYENLLSSVEFGGLLRFGRTFQTDRYSIITIPIVGYNTVDKWKVGTSFMAGSPMGPGSFTWGITYGTDSRKVGFHGSLSYRLRSSLASNARIGANFYNDTGLRSYTAWGTITNGSGLPIPAGQPGFAVYPIRSLYFGIRYADRYDSRYFNSDWHSTGKTVESTLRLGYARKGYHGVTSVSFSIINGVDILDVDYSFNKFLLRMSQDFRLVRTGELIGKFAVSLGYVGGYPPMHQKLHVGRGVPVSTVDPLQKLSGFGDAGVRGYDYEPILGDRLYVTSLELRSEKVQKRNIKPFLFFDLGQVNGDGTLPQHNKLLLNTGLGVSMAGMCEIAFPVWVNEPVDDEKALQFRAVFSFKLGI